MTDSPSNPPRSGEGDGKSGERPPQPTTRFELTREDVSLLFFALGVACGAAFQQELPESGKAIYELARKFNQQGSANATDH